jgi:hypothetical protein
MNRAVDAGFRGKTLEEAEGLATHAVPHGPAAVIGAPHGGGS